MDVWTSTCWNATFGSLKKVCLPDQSKVTASHLASWASSSTGLRHRLATALTYSRDLKPLLEESIELANVIQGAEVLEFLSQMAAFLSSGDPSTHFRCADVMAMQRTSRSYLKPKARRSETTAKSMELYKRLDELHQSPLFSDPGSVLDVSMRVLETESLQVLGPVANSFAAGFGSRPLQAVDMAVVRANGDCFGPSRPELDAAGKFGRSLNTS